MARNSYQKKTGHQPGRDSDTHESRQARKVGQDAKITMVNADKKYGSDSPVGRDHGRNKIDMGERKMSISASKYRERGRSPKVLSGKK